MRLAAKLLAEVEVSASTSNQHEFNGGLLRKALDLPAGRTNGTLDVTYLPLGDDEPTGETCDFTLYNAREDKPRSPEYRLYFTSTQLQAVARPGDILVVVRRDAGNDLKALIVPAESGIGQALAGILADEGVELSQRFRQIKLLVEADDLDRLLYATAEPVAPAAADLLTLANREFIEHALAVGQLPSTRRMADEAVEMVRRLRRGTIDPDTGLYLSLQAETALFHHLEEKIGQRALDRLAATGSVTFAAATALILSQLQSRKSRRGQSLQHHFRVILDEQAIPYSAQCRTERGETPDFVMPGCPQYGDRAFPNDRLRMVACKSTLRERWGQILKEADRIENKYVLTLDASVTDDRIMHMLEKKLRLFMPLPVISESYTGRATVQSLGSVADLIRELKAA